MPNIDNSATEEIFLWIIVIPIIYYFQFYELSSYRISVGAAWIAGQDRSMWRTLRPSAGQAQQ